MNLSEKTIWKRSKKEESLIWECAKQVSATEWNAWIDLVDQKYKYYNKKSVSGCPVPLPKDVERLLLMKYIPRITRFKRKTWKLKELAPLPQKRK